MEQIPPMTTPPGSMYHHSMVHGLSIFHTYTFTLALKTTRKSGRYIDKSCSLSAGLQRTSTQPIILGPTDNRSLHKLQLVSSLPNYHFHVCKGCHWCNYYIAQQQTHYLIVTFLSISFIPQVINRQVRLAAIYLCRDGMCDNVGYFNAWNPAIFVLYCLPLLPLHLFDFHENHIFHLFVSFWWIQYTFGVCCID